MAIAYREPAGNVKKAKSSSLAVVAPSGWAKNDFGILIATTSVTNCGALSLVEGLLSIGWIDFGETTWEESGIVRRARMWSKLLVGAFTGWPEVKVASGEPTMELTTVAADFGTFSAATPIAGISSGWTINSGSNTGTVSAISGLPIGTSPLLIAIGTSVGLNTTVTPGTWRTLSEGVAINVFQRESLREGESLPITSYGMKAAKPTAAVMLAVGPNRQQQPIGMM